jgi:hypothetical protein
MEKAMSDSTIKSLLAIAAFGIATTSNAATLSFPSFRIDVDDGWVHTVEGGPSTHDEAGELINIFHPNGDGVLKIRPYRAPDLVSQENLRNMTNVDSSTPLTWQNWGDYAGYQYDYFEKDSFYRQWWLVNESTIIVIVYDSHTEANGIEIDEINEIVDSITLNRR